MQRNPNNLHRSLAFKKVKHNFTFIRPGLCIVMYRDGGKEKRKKINLKTPWLTSAVV